MENQNKKVLNYSLEFLLGDRFGKYSKFVIQDRALPDVRDGLKPVQRRILYAMYVDNNTSAKPHRKSAKTVGSVIANYHPHGESSVYEAIVRMSQWWKMREPLIDMHGNNGSLDDDPPAAMRYTETRLSPISEELLKDLDFDTVSWAPNFDDSTLEPTVLPARFPNLLVNGARGVASGYATFIPAHNLKEVIDATIFRLKHPTCTLEEILPLIQGPDLPTGGIIQGNQGIIEAFKTGVGAFQVVSKYEWFEQKNIVSLIVTEIPFDVVKSDLVSEIDHLRIDKVIDGIVEVRDESDRQGLRIAIDLKKEADRQAILQYLLKKTSLSIRLNYNIVTIVNKRPMQIGLIPILDAYIAHQMDVSTRRSNYELAKAQARLHIVNGLILTLKNLDEVVTLIRSSKDKSDAKKKLEDRFQLDDVQSEAIVVLQLYRLTSTDVQDLEDENRQLQKQVLHLQDLLAHTEKMQNLIIKELQMIVQAYPSPRRTVIYPDEMNLGPVVKPITKEDMMVVVTRDGYFKRSSIKSYSSSEVKAGYKVGDLILTEIKANTADSLLCFTNKGNYLSVPIYELAETKWRDEGAHISSFIALNGDEKIVKAFVIKSTVEGLSVVLASQKGQIKKTALTEFTGSRIRKPLRCMVLDSDDSLIDCDISDGDSSILVFTNQGQVIQYHETNVSLIGLKTSGVKSIQKDKDETVQSMLVIRKNEDPLILVVSVEGGHRLFSVQQIPMSERLSKPTELYKSFKTEPHQLARAIKYLPTTPVDVLTHEGKVLTFVIDGNKPSPLGKPLRKSIETNNEPIIGLSNPKNTLIITADMPTYKVVIEPVKKEPELIAEDSDDGYHFTIFDYIDKESK